MVQRTPAARRRWRALLALFVLTTIPLVAIDCLPAGDDDLPSTNPPGRSPTVLKLFVPQAARRAGATLPVAVEVTIGNADRGEHDHACVALTADPGLIRFPFGDACASDSGPGEEGGQQDAEAAETGATEADAGGGAATMPGSSRSCLRLAATSGSVTRSGAAVASYTPAATESTVTLFGALYAGRECSGETIAQTAVVVRIADDEPADDGGDVDAADGGGEAGGDDGGGPDTGDGGDGGDGGDVIDAEGPVEGGDE